MKPTAWLRQRVRAARRNAMIRDLTKLSVQEKAPTKPVAIVFGNCQAAPISTLLGASTSFAEHYRVVRVPPVHEITAAELQIFERALPKVSLYVTQEIKDDYRGIKVGTAQLTALLPANATVIKYPVLYYEGINPFQVYVRAGGLTSEQAPITDYTDLRYLALASRGQDLAHAIQEFEEYVPPASALLRIHADSINALRDREQSLDVQMSSQIEASYQSTASFHTVNHPSNAILANEVQQVHELLALPFQHMATERPELLGRARSPLESPVVAALDLSLPARPSWQIAGTEYTHEQLLGAHLRWFSNNPEFVSAGVEQHKEKLGSLGLI